MCANIYSIRHLRRMENKRTARTINTAGRQLENSRQAKTRLNWSAW